MYAAFCNVKRDAPTAHMNLPARCPHTASVNCRVYISADLPENDLPGGGGELGGTHTRHTRQRERERREERDCQTKHHGSRSCSPSLAQNLVVEKPLGVKIWSVVMVPARPSPVADLLSTSYRSVPVLSSHAHTPPTLPCPASSPVAGGAVRMGAAHPPSRIRPPHGFAHATRPQHWYGHRCRRSRHFSWLLIGHL
jgi:hypothetical protein